MIRALVPLTLMALAASPAFAQTVTPTAERPRIAVTGEGEATIRPDMAMVSLAVMREAATAREALDDNNAAMAAVIAAMKAEGIAETDLQTSAFNIQPRYVYPENNSNGEQPKIVGYQVTNSLGVRVRDLTKLGELLDKAVTLGVNQGGEINFTNDDPSATRTEARKKAVQDAMARAKTLAEAASVTLGPVIEITETSFTQPPMPMMAKSFAARDAAAAVPVEAGEQSYKVQVNVTFAIAQ